MSGVDANQHVVLVPECITLNRVCHDHCTCPEVRVESKDAPPYFQEKQRGLIPDWHPDDYDPDD